VAISSGLKSQLTAADIGDLLDQLGKLLDRTKVMYEQYFMGIQKLAPSQLHRDIDRRVRELTQLQIRNTGLRFRFATLTQKYGSYNTYWKRIMRQIERGQYVRDVARATRRAARRGEDVPDELLLNMPRRLRERILRDREQVAKRAEKEAARRGEGGADEPGAVRNPDRGLHVLDEDLDLDGIFASLTAEGEGETAAPAPAPRDPEPRQPSRPSYATIRAPRPQPDAPPPPEIDQPPEANLSRGPLVGGMTERESRELFESYRKARQTVGDDRPVTYNQLMSKLGKQAPQIMRQHNARAVGFSVVVKGDKVVVKAKPKV
jgi:hypothetical protein